MTTVELIRDMHLAAAGVSPRTSLVVPAGQIVELVNGYWAAEKRADQLEAQLAAAEARIALLLADDPTEVEIDLGMSLLPNPVRFA